MRLKSIISIRRAESIKIFSMTFLLLAYLTGTNQFIVNNFLITRASTVLHTPEQEKDPCHRTIYHYEKHPCPHKFHLITGDNCDHSFLFSHSDAVLASHACREFVACECDYTEKLIAIRFDDANKLLPPRSPPAV